MAQQTSIIKPAIYFRADGNTQIGLGHITRCLALADMLRENFDCVFLVQNPVPAVRAQIEPDFKLMILPETEDFLAEARFLTETILQKGQIIVLDHYQIRTEYQQILKSAGLKVVCIDDMHAWHFVADVVINHAGGVKESDYSCEPYTKLCLGLKYALLRKPFLEAAKQERVIEKIENVFICFGGSDLHNFTEKALKACIEAQVFKEIHVVVGSAYTYFASLKSLIIQEKNVFLYQNLNAQDLCGVMQKCHLGIVPASSIAYECLAVGMYLMIGYYVGNQKNFYNFFSKEKIKTLGKLSNIDTLFFKEAILGCSKIMKTDCPKRFFFRKDKIKNIFAQLNITL